MSDRLQQRKTLIRPPPGSAPGTLMVDPHALLPVIHAMAYGPEGLVEKKLSSPGEVAEFLGQWPVTWLNVDGLGDPDTLLKVGEIFDIHLLALEDVLYVHQRAKVESYAANQFAVVRMVSLNHHVETEQVSLFWGKNYVVTFQERPGDCFDPVRMRIRKPSQRIRFLGADFLAYALLDAVVDAYFPILEQYGDKLDLLQEEVMRLPSKRTIIRVHQAKRDLRALRRAIWPLRDLFNSLCRDPLPFIQEETRIYFRDCYDHAVQVMDLVETYREMGSDLTDVYLASVSNRMNEVMKVLTVIATVFMPLTFVVGLYGMNFNTEKSPWNMPELNWYFGYPFAWGLIVLSGLAMWLFFRNKGWVGSEERRRLKDNHDEAARQRGGK